MVTPYTVILLCSSLDFSYLYSLLVDFLSPFSFPPFLRLFVQVGGAHGQVMSGSQAARQPGSSDSQSVLSTGFQGDARAVSHIFRSSLFAPQLAATQPKKQGQCQARPGQVQITVQKQAWTKPRFPLSGCSGLALAI